MYHLQEPSEDIQLEYRDFDGVPDGLIKNAIYAKTEKEAEELCSAYLGKRHGYANDEDRTSPEGAFSA